MASYFIRRLLLIIPTFIGITIISFFILQLAPGGPIEIEMMNYRTGNTRDSESGTFSKGGSNFEIPESILNEMKKFYGFDKPVHIRYIHWLGNLLTLDLGNSYTYNNKPVWDLIVSRFPVSLKFGLAGFILSYLICIPLGVMKAVKNGSKFDFFTSMIVFIGYSVPGWALGAILLIFFGGGSFWDLFPLGGVVSQNHDSLPFLNRIWDGAYHMILPVTSYVISSFAVLTILTKNSVIETLSQDYIRTAYAKGLSEKRVLISHALRNSLIPIATGLGHFISIVLAGSVLIETVFNIDGIGMLGYKSILSRDYPITMGILVFQSMLMMIGNIFSDIIYVFVDPRIRFK